MNDSNLRSRFHSAIGDPAVPTDLTSNARRVLNGYLERPPSRISSGLVLLAAVVLAIAVVAVLLTPRLLKQPAIPVVAPSPSASPSVSSPSPSPSAPFFVQNGACAHSVAAGATDTWTVVARGAGGTPVLRVAGLPVTDAHGQGRYGTFTDNGDGTATIRVVAPARAASTSARIVITATLFGVSTKLDCIEAVRGAAIVVTPGGSENSTISGFVEALVWINAVPTPILIPSAGSNATVELTPGNLTTTTDAEGYFSFRQLGAGTYRVVLTAPSGFHAISATTMTASVDGTDSATLAFRVETDAPPPPRAGSPAGSRPVAHVGLSAFNSRGLGRIGTRIAIEPRDSVSPTSIGCMTHPASSPTSTSGSRRLRA